MAYAYITVVWSSEECTCEKEKGRNKTHDFAEDTIKYWALRVSVILYFVHVNHSLQTNSLLVIVCRLTFIDSVSYSTGVFVLYTLSKVHRTPDK